MAIGCAMHKVIVSIWNREKLPEEWKELIIVPRSIRRGIKDVISIGAYHCCQLVTKFCPTSCSQGSFHTQRKLLGIINVDSDTILQILIIYILYSSNTWEKIEYNEAVLQLIIHFKKAYNSVRREALYNILTAFGKTKKQVRPIKMCLTETYSTVRVGKNLS
jgi:hypothetical protein